MGGGSEEGGNVCERAKDKQDRNDGVLRSSTCKRCINKTWDSFGDMTLTQLGGRENYTIIH